MFWRVATFSQASPIDAILDKENFTLEELLDEDDIIQECKSANTRLVNFLKEASTIASLIRFLSEPPEDDTHFRYSFTACEIFCCELDDVFTTLLDDEGLMTSLFSLLDKPAPLNSTLAGYFGRVVGSLLIKRPEKTHEYLQKHKEILPKLVQHIDSTSAVEVVLRMVGADEVTSSGVTPPNTSDWLAKTDLMQLLLNCLCSEVPRGKHARLLQEAAQRNVAHILVMLAGSPNNPLTEQLTQQAYLRTMLEHAARPNSPVLRPILTVCIALLEPSRPPPLVNGGMSWGLMQGAMEGPMPTDPERVDMTSVRAAAAEISGYLHKFTELLGVAGEAGAQQQPFGTLKPPLGRRRLTVVEFGKALLSTNLPVATRAVIEGDFVPAVMKLFQEYPFNNILHSYVLQILESLLETLMPATDRTENDPSSVPQPPRSLAMSRDIGSLDMVAPEDVLNFLLDNCDLLEWIVNLKSRVPPVSTHFEAADKDKPLKAAYEGHLTELANKLLHVAAHNDSVQAALDLNKGWNDFVTDVIEPRNHVQDADQWDVGRPPMDTTQGSSEGDDDDNSLRHPHTYPFPSISDDPASDASDAPIPTFPPRYGDGEDEEDTASIDSDNSVEEDPGLVGPPSHHIADSDSDSDSSDGGDGGVYPRVRADFEDFEPQTIEDEDEVELGDEAKSPEPNSTDAAGKYSSGPEILWIMRDASDLNPPEEVSEENVPTNATSPRQAPDHVQEFVGGDEFTALAMQDTPKPDSAPDKAPEAKEFISTSFWKLPLRDLEDEELP